MAGQSARPKGPQPTRVQATDRAAVEEAAAVEDRVALAEAHELAGELKHLLIDA